MSARIQRFSRAESLRSDRFPLLVRRATDHTGTGRIAHEVTKVMLVNTGTTTLTHRAGHVTLHAGQAVILPPRHWYTGEPEDVVTTTTAYIDTAFVRAQAR